MNLRHRTGETVSYRNPYQRELGATRTLKSPRRRRRWCRSTAEAAAAISGLRRSASSHLRERGSNIWFHDPHELGLEGQQLEPVDRHTPLLGRASVSRQVID